MDITDKGDRFEIWILPFAFCVCFIKLSWDLFLTCIVHWIPHSGELIYQGRVFEFVSKCVVDSKYYPILPILFLTGRKMAEENIIEGPPLKRIINSSLGVISFMALKAHGNKILLVDAETKREISANLILNRAVCLSKWLKTKGIGPGKLVSISSENSLEFPVVPLATLFVGATFTAVNPEYIGGELKHALNLTKPAILFCWNKSERAILSRIDEFPFIEYIIFFGKQRIHHKKVVMFNDIIKGVTDSDTYSEDFIPESVDPEDSIALVLNSSGTTGLPKGVMISHNNFTAYLDIMKTKTESMVDIPTNECRITLVPLFHALGFILMFIFLLLGYKNVILRKFNPKVFLECLEKYKIETITVPPPLMVFLAKHPMVKNYNLSNLKVIGGGAAPISKSLEESLHKRFPFIMRTLQGYGLTEATFGLIMSDAKDFKLGSVGKVLPGIRCKVINDNARTLGPYEPGELCFQGPTITKGYIGDPKATSEAFDCDGWLHTGDIGYYDNEQYFFVVDRKKELIKYKGFQVAPAELEALLLQHKGVIDAAVVGLPDDEAGELPAAFIVRSPKSKVTAKALESFIAENISPQKRLRGGVYFINDIPKTASGKKLRRVLREQLLKLKSKL